MDEILCPIECTRSACPDPPDFIEKNGTWLLGVIASAAGLIGVLVTYFLKSRCTYLKCGCVSCDREPIELTVEDVDRTSTQTPVV